MLNWCTDNFKIILRIKFQILRFLKNRPLRLTSVLMNQHFLWDHNILESSQLVLAAIFMKLIIQNNISNIWYPPEAHEHIFLQKFTLSKSAFFSWELHGKGGRRRENSWKTASVKTCPNTNCTKTTLHHRLVKCHSKLL